MPRLGVGLIGLYAVLALISWWTTRALRRHAADHEHQALHDPLTGLPNRELFRRAPRSAGPRPDAGTAARSCWSTSTTSRRSTTRWATTRATSC